MFKASIYQHLRGENEMGKIVAIGGGEIGQNETFEIDRFIVEFAEIPHPKLLFIPTASSDNQITLRLLQSFFLVSGWDVQ